jgi:hypothetical protein
MTPADQPPRKAEDRYLRQTLSDPANLRDFLQQAVPQLAAGFVYEQARLLDREFPTEDWRQREADLPFEIPYRTAEGVLTALVCILLEHQSDTDPMMPLRLLYFAVCYWDKQWQEWTRQPRPRPPLRLHPVLPIVLYTGARPWGSNRTLLDLMGEPVEFHAYVPSWQPLFWNLAEQDPQQLLQGGAWLQLMAVMRMEEADAADFQAVCKAVFEHLATLQETEPVRWEKLLSAVLTFILAHRYRAEYAELKDLAIQAHPVKEQEVKVMIESMAQEWLKEGEVKGEAKGEAKGRAEGRAEGALLAYRDVLRRRLVRRFDPLPEAVLQRIEAATDVARLVAAIDRADEIKSLDELELE